MKKQSLRISMMATPLMIVCGLLVSSTSARAESENGACSNRTLRGDYGSAVEGLILPAPGVALPIRGVVMAHYDGDGNFTQVDHIVFNGIPPTLEWTPGTGTYQVNADCTGFATASGRRRDLVIVDRGTEYYTMVTVAGRAIPGVQKRQE